MPVHAEEAAGSSRFEEIVRAAGKEHLDLQLRVVRGPRAGMDTVIVSGPAHAAGYRREAGWLERFRSQLEGGLFG